jgi:hypothetical protein
VGEGGVGGERGLDYGLGKLADVYRRERDTPAPLVPFHLVHGTRDTVVDIQQPREFAAAGR